MGIRPLSTYISPYLKPGLMGLWWVLIRQKNQILLAGISILGLGGCLCSYYHHVLKKEIGHLQHVLMEQKKLEKQLDDHRQVTLQYAPYYTSFEQSFWLRISHSQKLEVLLRHLLFDERISLIKITIDLMVKGQKYDLYGVEVEVESLQDHDILDWMTLINLPNVMEVTHIQLRRQGELSSRQMEDIQSQSLEDMPPLVHGKISFTWLSWTHV